MSMSFRTLAAYFAVAMGITGGLAGCSGDASGATENGSENSAHNVLNRSNSTVKNVAGYDANVKAAEPRAAECTIRFSEEAAEVSGGDVSVDGTAVTITRPGVYSISGSCSAGKIIVDPSKGNDVTLLLDGVDLKSAEGSVIECRSGRRLTLYLPEGTRSILSDCGKYTFGTDETEPDGAVYSRSDMIIAGGGSLTVNGAYKDGIKCKDTLSLDCGELCVTAKDDGIVGKDCVVIQDGKYTVNAQRDGIRSTNSEDPSLGYITINGGEFNIASGCDGIQAQTALNVKGGTFDIVSGGEDADAEIDTAPGTPFDRDAENSDTDSQKGMKAGETLTVSDGDITVKAADDSIHSNGSVTVNGGTLRLSSCDDGIHADEMLIINGGSIDISKSYEGLEGMNIEINGGSISISAVDDGVNAAGGDNGGFLGFNSAENDYYISITGGEIVVNAGGDGIDSNGTIAQSGGVLIVYGPTDSGNGAVDYEKSYAVSGGTLIALGSRGMAQTPGTLSQPCLSIYADVSANSTVEVRAEDGSVILGTITPKSCQSLVFTCEQFRQGGKYGIYADGKLLCEVTATDGIAGGGADAQGGFGGGFFGGGHGGLISNGSRPEGFAPNGSRPEGLAPNFLRP